MTYAPATTPVKVILPFPPHALCAQHLLVEPLGFAAEEGITVSVDFTESPLDATQSVADGDHDVTEVNTLFAFRRREDRLPVKPFYAVCRAAYRRFAVVADSPITSVEGLRGARVGTDHPDLLGLAGPVLNEAGVDPVSDLTWITDYLRDVVPTEVDLKRLRAGEIDAIWTLADSFEMLQADGIALRRLPSRSLDTLTPSACLYAHTDALATNRSALAAYGRCVARTSAFCAAHPEEAVELVWKHFVDTRPAAGDEERARRRDLGAVVARAAVGDLRHGAMHRWGAITKPEIIAWEDFLFEHGTVTTRRAPDEYFDLGLIDDFNAWPGADEQTK